MPLSNMRLVAFALAVSALACGADAQNRPAPAPTVAPAASAAAPAKAAGTFDSGRAWEHLRRQVAIGPRVAGSPAIAETRRYLTAQLKSAGLAVREQPFTGDTPTGKVAMINLIATLPGKRSDRIIIATHYDTKIFKQFRFVGASDGASKTIALFISAIEAHSQCPVPDE